MSGCRMTHQPASMGGRYRVTPEFQELTTLYVGHDHHAAGKGGKGGGDRGRVREGGPGGWGQRDLCAARDSHHHMRTLHDGARRLARSRAYMSCPLPMEKK